jgi:transcriptional regulator with XRE-family HTH domain
LTNILGITLAFYNIAYYIRQMLTLSSIGTRVAAKRKAMRLSQTSLAKSASVGRSTLDALENGRSGELGFSKITKILSALGMELKLQETGSPRPTLDELIEEDRNDQSLDRRR